MFRNVVATHYGPNLVVYQSTPEKRCLGNDRLKRVAYARAPEKANAFPKGDTMLLDKFFTLIVSTGLRSQ
jgi:hypothetical protein